MDMNVKVFKTMPWCVDFCKKEFHFRFVEKYFIQKREWIILGEVLGEIGPPFIFVEVRGLQFHSITSTTSLKIVLRTTENNLSHVQNYEIGEIYAL